MKHKPLGVGQTVKIHPQVKEHGGKLGTVVFEGQELGWHVIKVKFGDLPRPVTFSPDEVAKS
jgi:hypothetical protein